MSVCESKSPPYCRLSAYYFFSCAIYGAMLPYWVLWMRDQGYSTVEIGGVTSAQILMTLAGTYFFGYLSDKTGKPLRLVRIGVMIALIIFAAVFWVAENYLGIIMVLAGSSFFWQGINAQFEVITLRHLGRYKDNYSLVRLVGSVGFVLSVWATGHLLEVIDIGYLPFLLLGLMGLLLVTSWINYGGQITPGQGESLTIRSHLKKPVVLLTLAIFFLSNLSHGSYYGFFSLFLEERGYSQGEIGNLWSVAVVFELMMFAVMPMMLRYMSYTRILTISLALTVVRWAMMATEPLTWWALAFIQLLHGFTFSWVHSVGILMFKQLFPNALEGRGQALFAGGCAAAGQAIGIASAGYLWNLGAGLTFAISAACALLALALTLALTPQKLQASQDSVSG